MSAPSESRWRAFSVRPPSATRSSVSARVSSGKAASISVRSAVGRVWIEAALVAPPAHRASFS